MQGDVLRRVADRLSEEFIDPEAPELPDLRSTLSEEGVVTTTLEAVDEAVVKRMREVLAGIASTLSAGTQEPPVRAIKSALEGAEVVIRGELARDNPERVLRLMPSFVYLAAIAVADQDRALEISRRTAELTLDA